MTQLAPTTDRRSTHAATDSDDRHVAVMFELAVREGREPAFRALMAEMVDATRRAEPGTVAYEWDVTDDGRRLHLYERYADSDAALTHLGTFAERYLPRFIDVLAPERLTVYGAPDDRVREAMAQLAPRFVTRAAGFTR